MRKLITMLLLSLVFTACSSGGSSSNSSDATPVNRAIPELTRWEAQMIEFGTTLFNRLQSQTDFDTNLAETFYDSQWVFYQIGDYTGDSSWYERAQTAEKIYRDDYVLANAGFVPGFWLFPHGLAQDYIRTGDKLSLIALQDIATNGAYARDSTDPSETLHVDFSRETAYAILTYIQTELVGEARRERLALLLEHCLGHFDQWFGRKTAPYVRPFMVGLSAHALISYYENINRDDRIPMAIADAADWLWDHTWLAEQESFMYTDRETSSGGQEAAPDLNLLIAPMYAWLYYNSALAVYAERGDQIFAGGVKGAYLEFGKQFNQNYRWSFDYIKWRS